MATQASAITFIGAPGLGLANGRPGAWLLCSQEMRRALLLVGAELPTTAQEPDHGIHIDSGLPPTPEALNRLWLWERMATPRHWRIRIRIRIQPDTMTPLWLPCWLGYMRGRKHRLIVISGLSGEPLPMLKPTILRGLQQAHSEVMNTAANEQRRSSI